MINLPDEWESTDDALIEYERLKAVDASRRRTIEELTEMVSSLRRTVEDEQRKYRGMLAREDRYRLQVDELKAQLARLRSSRRYLLGSAVVDPGGSARKLWRRSRGRGSRAVASRGAPVRSKPALTLAELRRQMLASPGPKTALSYATQALYAEGRISEAVDALASVDLSQATLTPQQARAVQRIRGLDALRRFPPAIPPRQSNPAFIPVRGRVLYCAHQSQPYNSNGYAMRTAGLVDALSAGGVDVVVAGRPGYPWDETSPQTPPETGRHVLSRNGVPHVFIPGMGLDEHGLETYLQWASDALSREATRQRVGLIHAASNHIIGLAALLAARRLGLPFVYEVRGLWEITRASTRPAWADSEHFELQKDLESLVASSADAVLAITEEVAEELVRRGVEADRITVVPNCVDTEIFAPLSKDTQLAESLSISPEMPVVGYCGSLVEYEGLDLLVAALAELRARGRAFQLLIVGDGATLPAVRQQVVRLGLDSCTIFTGRVESHQVPRYIGLMDILPVPRQSLPVTELVSALKPLEAMAMGKAVVLSDVSPHLALAGDGASARAALFRKGDAGDLVRVLDELLSSATTREQLGTRARQWVATERTWGSAANAVGLAYERSRFHHAASTAVGRPLRELHIALISDRFTRDTLAPEATFHQITPGNWRRVLEEQDIDALLVESAWEGIDRAWHRRVGYYSADEIEELRQLVDECRQRRIPTLFWNKEDPVHFARFQKTAAMFDHVFTTDAGKIADYAATDERKAKTLASASFFAQPRIHNPLPTLAPREQLICYGGTYYGARFPDRTAALDPLLRAAKPLGLVIYDRQHDLADSPYRFPPELAEHVHGGLDYADMVEAYRRLPVHLNVNSVLDSPTMFSRRVLEIAACGGAVLSGPGQGVAEVMDGTVPVAEEQEVAAAFLRGWMTDESERHATVWPAMRHVLRAHTAGQRLALILRTAGLAVAAPELPRYALLCEALTEEVAEAVARQTVLPAAVVYAAEPAAGASSLPAGVRALGFSDDLDLALQDLAVKWVGRLGEFGLAELADEHFEDLLNASAYGEWTALGESVTRPEPATSVSLALPGPTPKGDGTLRSLAAAPALDPASLLGWFDEEAPDGLLLQRVRTLESRETVPAPDGGGRRTILAAGHDLKFVKRVLSELECRGHRILIDEWDGHNIHDEARSLELLKQADVVFCEWALGNAVWYAQHKRPGQRLVVRLHRQETRSPLLRRIDFSQVDAVVFVAPHVRDEVIRDYGLDPRKALVVPNYVDVASLDLPKESSASRTIGLVGITPRMKRLDLALDAFAEARREEPDLRLRIKGRRPEEYSWMANRPDELGWYESQYQRIRHDAELSGRVLFDGHSNDMAAWYQRIGIVLSVSDFESFHLTIADGAASRALPVIRPWAGADRIYPPSWVSEDVEDIPGRIIRFARLASDERGELAERAREFVVERFSLERVVDSLEELLLASNVGSGRA